MSHTIVTSDSEGVHLRRNAELYLLPLVSGCIGFVQLLVGVFGLFASGPQVFSLIFTIGGTFFLIVPWLILRLFRTAEAEHLIFDNRSASLYVLMKDAVQTGEFATIAYDDIEAFSVRPSVTTNQSTSTNMLRDLCVDMKDGSWLALVTNISSQTKAEALLHTVEHAVRLDASMMHGAMHTLNALPTSIEFHRRQSHSEYRWRTTVSKVMAVFLVFFFLVFFSIVASFMYGSFGDSTFVAAVAVIGGVGLLVMILVVRNFIRMRGVSHVIRVDAAGVEIFDEAASQERRTEMRLPLIDIAFVGFGPYQTGDTHEILFVSKESQEAFAALKQQSSDIKDWSSNLRSGWKAALSEKQSMKAQLGSMNIVQMLNVLQNINNEIDSYKGESVHSATSAVATLPPTIQSMLLNSKGSSGVLDKFLLNRMQATLAVLSVFLIFIAWFLVLPFQGVQGIVNLRWLFELATLFQVIISLSLSWNLMKKNSLFIPGVLLLITVLLCSADQYFQMDWFGFSLSFKRFILNALLLVCGWRLFRISEPEPKN